MTARPTGTVTFLFTDIEGSTRHWEEHRAWMEHAFARQEAIIREALAGLASSRQLAVDQRQCRSSCGQDQG